MTVGEFKALVNGIEPNKFGCKLWPRGRSGAYGRVVINGTHYRAHRASFTFFKGEIPDGFFACHKCDCPPCVNPEHLFAGSHQENMWDMAQKGRGSTTPKQEAVLPLFKPLKTPEEGPKYSRFLYYGKLIEVHFHPMGGWMAVIDGKTNIVNPWRQTFFSRWRGCRQVAKFYVRHGFYPGLKPSKWRLKQGLPCIQ